jgi:hypothetical protein
MTPPRVRTDGELQEERHQQNLRKFSQIDLALEANTKLTQQALTENQSNRHQLKGLNMSLVSMLKMYEDDKAERKEERKASEALRVREIEKLEDARARELQKMEEARAHEMRKLEEARKAELAVTSAALEKQASEIKKLTVRFAWGVGFLTALSFVFHELGDLISPVIRHLLQ